MAYKKSNKKTRKERVQEATEKMEKQVEEYFTSPEQLQEYLSFMTQFYNYSPRNSALIHSQFRGAKAVGSFKFWKDKGFSVQKGEKSIQILTPNKTTHKYKNEQDKWKNIKYANSTEKKMIEEGLLEERKPRLYFSIGHVFDISQTDAKAKDLPDIFPNKWLEGNVENYTVLMDSFKNIASNMNVTVGEPFEEIGSAKGVFYHSVSNDTRGHIGLNPRNGELQNVKTMAHELAHAKLHHGIKTFELSDAEKEFQAEMVAYTVNDYFGIDTSDYSLKYLANWTENTKFEDKIKLIEEVRDTSVEFIEKIEEDLIKQKENEVTMSELNTEEVKNNNFANKSEDRLYWYELKKRPMSIGTQPKNMKLFDENKGEYGIIAYNEPLSDKELQEYEIEPYIEKKEQQEKNQHKEQEIEMQ